MIKAMKQALEALVSSTGELRLRLASPTDAQLVKNEKAIIALRQAIAEAEKQEPVAWMHPDGRLWTFGKGFYKSTFAIPLYTAPPQRKPLSDEEIVGIAQITCIGISPQDDTVNFARAIEAAHGIKGEV